MNRICSVFKLTSLAASPLEVRQAAGKPVAKFRLLALAFDSILDREIQP